jgi:hypothetical protein
MPSEDQEALGLRNSAAIASRLGNFEAFPIAPVWAAIRRSADIFDVHANEWLLSSDQESVEASWLGEMACKTPEASQQTTTAALVRDVLAEDAVAVSRGEAMGGESLAGLQKLRRSCWAAIYGSRPPTEAAIEPIVVPTRHKLSEKKRREVGYLAACVDACSGDARPLVIDVGAGQGDLVRTLADIGHRAVGVDRDDVQTHGSIAKLAPKDTRNFAVCSCDIRAATDPVALEGAATKAFEPLQTARSDSSGGRTVLCSLHACGALSDNFIGLASRWNCAEGAATKCDAAISLGCCYNLMAHGEATAIKHLPVSRSCCDAVPAPDKGRGRPGGDSALQAPFPSSDVVRAATGNTLLSHGMLTAAAQCPRLWSGAMLETIAGVFERSVAESVMLRCAREVNADVRSLGRVRPAAPIGPQHPHGSAALFAERFASTVCDAISSAQTLGKPGAERRAVDVVDVAVALEARYRRCVAAGLDRAFTAAWAVRAALGELLELLLLVDRCHRLAAAAGWRVALVPVLPLDLSPRCLAVIGQYSGPTEQPAAC